MAPVIRDATLYPAVRASSSQVADIVSSLRNEIVSGAIAPGAPLGQESLAERFGVSRMPIREALRHLQSMGFVTIEANKRPRVAALSREDLTDIYDMRKALEVVAIRAALPNLTNAEIDKAAAIQRKLRNVSALEFGIHNHAFHMTLYRPSGRVRLLAQIDILFNAADRYLCIAQSPPGQREKSDAEHTELLDICRSRDAMAAEDLLKRHIGDARKVFEGLL